MLDLLLSGVTDRDAQAWAVAVRGAGAIVSGAQVRRVARFIRGLKADGVWSALDRLWLFAGENSTQALTDLKARASATAVASPTFTANQGYTGNATSSYVDTNLNVSTAGGNYAQNSASFGVYSRSARTASAAKAIMAGNISAAATATQLYPIYSDGKLYADCNGNTGSTQGTSPNAGGMFVVSRTASNLTTTYRNGASVFSSVGTGSSMPSGFFVGAGRNSLSAAADFSDDQIAAAFIGGGLTSAQALTLTTRLNTYMTALSTNVF